MLIKLSAALYVQRETFTTLESPLGVSVVSISRLALFTNCRSRSGVNNTTNLKNVLIETYKGEGGKRFKAVDGAFTISCFGQ